MIIKIILLLSWVAIALLEGSRDAFFYNARMNLTKPDGHNIHWVFAFERGIVLGLLCWLHALSYSMLNTGVFAFSLILIFSFWHNGIYCMIRNRLDKNVYPKGWFDSSATSESFLEFSAVSRTFMAMVGAMGIVASLTFN